MKISVIGAGYVGLVTGACFAYVGNEVHCLDINKQKINNLRRNKIPIFEEKLDKIIEDSVDKKRLFFSSNLEKTIKSSNIIFLAVSTPMNDDGSSNLEYILKAAKDIGKSIESYKVIVVKSTVPVGVTSRIKEVIEKEIKKRNKDIFFDIANNPEFLKEGKAVDDFMSPDRIIVGIENQELREKFKSLYRPFSMNHQKLIFVDIPSSELIKYAANAMLATKISFINEISQLCEKVGANINDVRIGIGSDNRIGYDFIYPSIGFGGSCFPKDVNSLKKQFEEVGLNPAMSEATLRVNDRQWKNFCARIINYFSNYKESKHSVCIWGVTFKPGTDDIRESQALKIINKLLDNNFHVNIYDPKGMKNAKSFFANMKNISFYNSKYEAIENTDALILLTEWKEFRSPDFNKIKRLLKNPIIFDGRNIYRTQEMLSYGFEYFQVGVMK